MATAERLFDRGTRQGDRWLRLLAQEFRAARLTLGLSQEAVARAARVSRSVYGRAERGELRTLAVVAASRLATVLGLDLFVALYPGARGLRDEVSARMVKRLVSETGPPMRHKTEVPLPRRTESREVRSWDLVTFAGGTRTAYEFESRLYDAQAQTRRRNLKLRDDPVENFVLVVADTAANRRVLEEFAELFADLPRLKTATVLDSLKSGHHPPTGLILL